MKLQDMYWALLRLYPYDYRIRFAGEMREAFAETLGDCRKLGKRSVARFAAAELAALAFGVLREWTAKLSADSSRRRRTLPDIRKMRPVDITREQWFATAGLAVDGQRSASLFREAEIRTNFFLQQIVGAIARGDFENARACSYQEMAERRKLLALRNESDGG